MKPSRSHGVRAFLLIAVTAISVPACAISANESGPVPAQAPEAAAPAPSGSRAAMDRRVDAAAINNRGVEQLRLGAAAAAAGRPADAQRHFEAALDYAVAAIEVVDGTQDPQTATYARGWANKGYALWKLGRIGEAAAAARTVLPIEPKYPLNPEFLAALESAGYPLSSARSDAAARTALSASRNLGGAV